MSPINTSVLLIYTGGTIGMIENAETGALENFNFEQLQKHIPELQKFNFPIDTYQFDPPMDSSDMEPDMWQKLVHVIHDNYERYQGFVILHGTDTMAYTASALSFMLEGLDKPVILTGSQLPIGVLRTDGKENLMTSIEIAIARNKEGKALVPEVCIFFENHLMRGNRIYRSVVLDQLKQLPDSTFNFDQLELDYFKDVYLNLFHNIEIVNGLFVKAGVSVHWRYLINNSKVILEKPLPDKDWAALRGIRSEYNSFAPRIRIEWTPGMYYYMNGRRKMNVGSSMPTFMLDYERGIKGVFKSTGAHERWEFDIQQNLKLSGIRSIGYRIGGGMFTKQEDMYFVDFANFARRNLPEGWNDDIGGTFQLLDGRWYNSSRQYWRGNFTYESPFILLKPLNRWLGLVQQERLYGGILFMPHLNPYIELGYGIGTHIFDVGAFVSTINGQFDTFGFKFTFELFNK